MRQTVKHVAAFFVVGLLLIFSNEMGWLYLPERYGKVLTEIGVALMAVGLIHWLDHAALIPLTAEAIEKQSRDVFMQEVDKTATKIVEKVAGQTDTALHSAGERIIDNVAAKTGSALDSAATKIASNVAEKTDSALDSATKKTARALDEASQVLQRQVESIKVMEQNNLVSLYESRAAAAEAMRAAIADSQTVRLMGISFNEFVKLDQSPFRRAWHDIVKAVQVGSKTVEILVIDPYCHGAILRSFAETKDSEGTAGRLETDVIDAARHLRTIRRGLPDPSKLHVRLYGIAPTTFLCQLDSVTFVQPYHFWNGRLAGSPTPLFQYRKREEGQAGLCMHREMTQHFTFIRDHAAIELDDFMPVPSRGLEWGSHVAGTSAVFVDRHRPSFRMSDEINRSKRIWIQGITLKSFFSDPTLSKALKEKILEADDSVDIRILLLDTACEQAKQRAFREFQLNAGTDLPFDDFISQEYQTSKLVMDSRDTMIGVRRMAPVDGAASGMEVRKYDTAPHMFVLIGDTCAFVEQYSYGKLPDEPTSGQEDRILGSDMPLIEYRKTLDSVYTRVINDISEKETAEMRDLRPQPYFLLESHFKYAWSKARPIALSAATGDSRNRAAHGNTSAATAAAGTGAANGGTGGAMPSHDRTVI